MLEAVLKVATVVLKKINVFVILAMLVIHLVRFRVGISDLQIFCPDRNHPILVDPLIQFLDANYPFLNTCVIETECPTQKPTGQTGDQLPG